MYIYLTMCIIIEEKNFVGVLIIKSIKMIENITTGI